MPGLGAVFLLKTDRLPDLLADIAASNWARVVEAADGCGDTGAAERLEAFVREQDTADLAKVLACSPFVADLAAAQPDWFGAFLEERAFATPLDPERLAVAVDASLVGIGDIEAMKPALRVVRNRLMATMIWRDATGLADLAETTATMSTMADLILDRSLALLYQCAVASRGAPIGEGSGEPQQLVVIALGKLGAEELNLSSDIDLVFAYPEDGETAAGRTSRQFFTSLGQQLIQALDAVTADGFVFRVDMRLRPFGDSGPLVASFSSMERYFEEHGRDWERYAWIRARVAAGDRRAGAELIETLQPFVFRRYLDFGAIDALRDMKHRILTERSKTRVANDVKLGPGGIREVEFIAQMLQLIWAGRHLALRERRIGATYQALVDLGLMDADTGNALFAAYEFLRNVEHKLQGMRDQQTQKLPTDEVDRARLIAMMGFADGATFETTLRERRTRVSDEFTGLIESSEGGRGGDRWRELWSEDDPELLDSRLHSAGFRDVAMVGRELQRLRAARDRPSVGNEGSARLDKLMPLFLAAAVETSRPDLAVARVVPLFESILRRSAYFMLLLENPQALQELVHICASSRWLSDELALHPALLDELLDPNLLYTVADKPTLRAALKERLHWVADDDFEAQLDVLRNFKESHSFRVAACELKGILPLMNVSDYLTFLAEVILEQALDIAWSTTDGTPPQAEVGRPFIIVGYGKLGGIELGPSSDLDLVFIHKLGDEHIRFLHRMVRRLMQVLTTRTHAGSLYEVDMRLRPSGHAGTLVSSLEAFEKYQTGQAWTWEHQALVRARVVAGDGALAADFDAMRRRILCQPRERDKLKADVLEMRRRIEGAASGDADLKRPAGGIVDIEFMVQYLVVGWAQDYPELCSVTDNIRILETAAGLRLIDEEQAHTLKDAYLALRAERHRTALDIADDQRAQEVRSRYREQIRTIWDALFA